MKNNKCLSTFLNGLIKENPVLVLVLGTCPTLATTRSERCLRTCVPNQILRAIQDNQMLSSD